MTTARNERGDRLRMGAMLLLACCFGLSAILRAGEVVAQLPSAGDDGFGNPLPKQAATGAVAASTPERVEVGPVALLEELERQRADLAAREAQVAARENKLKGLNAHLEKRLTEVQEAREALSKTASLVEGAATKDVAKLAQMYQQMKPKQAGQIFNEMAPSFAAGFIGEMRPDAAALIMANMDAEKAYAVSILLASRNMRSSAASGPPTALPN